MFSEGRVARWSHLLGFVRGMRPPAAGTEQGPPKLTCGYLLLLVFPRTNAPSTPRGPRPASSVLGTLAIRRAVLAR